MSEYKEAVAQGRKITEAERDCKVTITRNKKTIIFGRFEIGRIVSSITGDRAEYGASTIDRFADDIGFSANLVRECKRVFDFFEINTRLAAFVEELEEDNTVYWSSVVRHVSAEGVPDDEKISRKIDQIDRSARKLEQKGTELAEMMGQSNTALPDDVIDSAIGTLTKASQVISELNTSPYQKTYLYHDDDYRARVSRLPCVGRAPHDCGPSQPMHVESGGERIKGSDATCIPGCNAVHRFMHQHGWRAAEAEFDFDVVEEIAQTQHVIRTGSRFRLPKELLTLHHNPNGNTRKTLLRVQAR